MTLLVTSFALPTRFTQRNNTVIVHDTKRNRLVMFCGDTTAGVKLADWWQYQFATPELGWEQFFPNVAGTFPARSGHTGYYDPDRDKVVFYGGFDTGLSLLDDLWELSNGTDLAEVIPATTTPGTGFGIRFTYDPIRKLGIMHAGTDASFIDTNRTLTWNGADFAVLSPPTSPPPRNLHSQAWDPERQQTIVTHGSDGFIALRADTWGFDGITWTEIGSVNSPVGRRAAQFGYHPRRRSMILFSGTTLVGPIGGTFELPSNTGWRELHPDTPPSNRSQGSIHPDTVRGVALLNNGTFDLVTSPVDVNEIDADGEWSLTAQGNEYDGTKITIANGATLTDPATDPEATIAPAITKIVDSLDSVDLKGTAPVNTRLQIILELDEQATWHNATAWVDSDGTSAESNTEAEINANLSTLTVAEGTAYRPIVWLISDDSIATPEAEEIQTEAPFAVQPIPLPRQCTVFAKTSDFVGANVQGAVLRIVGPAGGFFHGDTHVRQYTESAPSGPDGTIQLDAFETETISQSVTLELVIGATTTAASVQIPDQDTVNARELLSP